eukprot:m.28110 g.28110  ORF g.28110 m.28110 type:complete len:97 (-) comp11991_c0_seq2:170-460(-)
MCHADTERTDVIDSDAPTLSLSLARIETLTAPSRLLHAHAPKHLSHECGTRVQSMVTTLQHINNNLLYASVGLKQKARCIGNIHARKQICTFEWIQ